MLTVIIMVIIIIESLLKAGAGLSVCACLQGSDFTVPQPRTVTKQICRVITIEYIIVGQSQETFFCSEYFYFEYFKYIFLIILTYFLLHDIFNAGLLLVVLVETPEL